MAGRVRWGYRKREEYRTVKKLGGRGRVKGERKKVVVEQGDYSERNDAVVRNADYLRRNKF